MSVAHTLRLLAVMTSLSGAVSAGEAPLTASSSARQSIARGRTVFQLHCTSCHGRDGKAQIDLIANATNLTRPDDYKHGKDDAAILNAITDGAGNMPAFKGSISEDDRRNLLSFIKSLWSAK